ncbi:MAG: hypothetical protein DLM68_07305 [Hyphomicrobiales bacterium]|nr:MAG: hypothetical protein DLM68_07305 [Hyphomicrobiales bacterium]
MAARHFIEAIDSNSERALSQHRAQQAAILERQAPFRENTEDTSNDPRGAALLVKGCFGEAPRLDRHEHITIASKDRKGSGLDSAKMDLAQMQKRRRLAHAGATLNPEVTPRSKAREHSVAVGDLAIGTGERQRQIRERLARGGRAAFPHIKIKQP